MDARFRTTRWSLVRRAADPAGPESRDALAELCRTYWPPVYAFVLQRERDPERGRELTQGFFTRLLDKGYVKDAEPERGRFRSFLLASVKHYLSNEWARDRARKRGGGVTFLPLDAEAEEAGLRIEPTDAVTPETLFERHWALSVLRQAVAGLERDMEESGQGEMFRWLRPFLSGGAPVGGYAEAARRLGVSESSLKIKVHRLRRRLGRQLRQEVAQTLSDPELLDEEMRFLRAALAR